MHMQKRFCVAMVLAGLFLASLYIFPTILFAFPTSDILPDRQGAAKNASHPASNLQIQQLSARLPLHFIVNQGQKDEWVKFYAQPGGASFWFTSQGITLKLPKGIKEGRRGSVVQITPLAMRPKVELTALEPLEGKVNYFIGNNPKKWRTGIPTCRAVLYREAYPGIDLKFYGNGSQLEYDVIVKPGADPRQVKLRYQGIRSLKVTPDGDLAITLPDGGELRQQKPVIYQEIAGQRLARQGTFQILDPATHTFGFRVAGYDRQYALVIDPVLVFSTYLGGNGDDRGQAIAVDKDGNICVAGHTASDNFPRANPYDDSLNVTDAFITKYNAAGSAMVFSTYFGGTGLDYGYGIAVDGDGNIYVTGATKSFSSFPTTSGTFQTTFGNGAYDADTTDAFVTKFNPTGSSLLYSSFLGGNKNDAGQGIAVDKSGCAYVTGNTESTNFPTTAGAYQATDPPPLYPATSGMDAFVTKVSADGASMVYSTYLGGELADQGVEIALDQSGPDPLACVTGWTVSSAATFPLKNAKQAIRGSATADGFVAKLNANGTDAIFCTFLGGNSYDEAYGVAVDGSGHVIVSGWTGSTNFPVTAGTYQPAKSGSYDAFVTKYEPDGSNYVFSTYLGGTGLEGTSSNIGFSYRVGVDGSGFIYVTGFTGSSDFPLKNPLYPFKVANEIFLTKFTPDGKALVYSTYLGGAGSDFPLGIAVDRAGTAYLTGFTTSTADFPLKDPLQDFHAGGTRDAFVIKVADPHSSPGSLLLLLEN